MDTGTVLYSTVQYCGSGARAKCSRPTSLEVCHVLRCAALHTRVITNFQRIRDSITASDATKTLKIAPFLQHMMQYVLCVHPTPLTAVNCWTMP